MGFDLHVWYEPMPITVERALFVRQGLDTRRMIGKIVERGAKPPIQAGGHWAVERTNSWVNDFGKLRRCTERRRTAVEFFTAPAGVIIAVRCLVRRARKLYRWDTRPRSRRIR